MLEVAALIKDALIKGLYERSGIFNLLPDHSFRITSQWADSVDFPVAPNVFVKQGAVTKASGDRTKLKNGWTKKNVPFGEPWTVAITEEAEARYMSDGEMADKTINDAVDALGDKLDAAVCTKFATGIPAGQKIPFAQAILSWEDIVTGTAAARALKIGASNLLLLVPPALEPAVKNLDVVKLAMANNANYFENGIGKIDTNYYVFSSAVPQVDGKDSILIANLNYTGRAIKKWMDRRDAYDRDTQDTDIDYLSYIAFDKLIDQAVIALQKPAA